MLNTENFVILFVPPQLQTGVLPRFVPFAQAFAAVITAALTGSLYYVAASPKGRFCHCSFWEIFSYPRVQFFTYSFIYFSSSDPTYVVAPVQRSGSAREDLKKLFAGAHSTRKTSFIQWYFSIVKFQKVDLSPWPWGKPNIIASLWTKCWNPTVAYVSIHFWFFFWQTCCSLVWEETNEKDLLSPFGRNIGPLPWIWMDRGNNFVALSK